MLRVLLPVCFCLSGCLVLLPPASPMVSVRHSLPQGQAKCLVVFLPGVRDAAEDFDEQGFIDALRAHQLSVDVVSAQATLPYYTHSVLVERLEADVIVPSQSRNYAQTWLIGVSMGGLGTLLYSHAHPDHVTGVLAMAPYLGKRYISTEIRDAGGLASWNAPQKPEKLDVKDDAAYQRELWRWLQALSSGKEKGPEIYVGWGTADPWLAEPVSILAAALPGQRTFPVEGGHEWIAWKKVLELFLADSSFSTSCR